MIFDVYVLDGDPIDALSRGATRGELVIRKRYYNRPDQSLYAEVLDPQGRSLLGPLTYVKLVGMSPRGMTIEGIFTGYLTKGPKSRTEKFIRRWLVKHVGAKAEVDTEKILKRSAIRLSQGAASGFDPADDNYLS